MLHLQTNLKQPQPKLEYKENERTPIHKAPKDAAVNFELPNKVNPNAKAIG